MSCKVWVFLYSSLPSVPVYHLISVTHELQTMHVLSTVKVLGTTVKCHRNLM